MQLADPTAEAEVAAYGTAYMVLEESQGHVQVIGVCLSVSVCICLHLSERDEGTLHGARSLHTNKNPGGRRDDRRILVLVDVDLELDVDLGLDLKSGSGSGSGLGLDLDLDLDLYLYVYLCLYLYQYLRQRRMLSGHTLCDMFFSMGPASCS